MNIKITIILFIILYINSSIVFAGDNDQYELHTISSDQNTDLTTINKSHAVNVNDVKRISSTEDKDTVKQKNKNYFNHDVIVKNKKKFNEIMYTGRDFLNPLPIPEDINACDTARAYTMVIFVSLLVGCTAVIPICSTQGILSVNEDNLKVLLKKMLSSFFTSQGSNIYLIIKNNLQYLDVFFNDPQNFIIRNDFFYLLVTITPLLSAITYSNIYFISNAISAKKNNKLLNDGSLASKITKVALSTTVSGLYIYGLVETINTAIQTINNMRINQELDTEDPIIRYLGCTLAGICSLEISFSICMPVANLIVDTLSLVPEIILRKKIDFKQISMPKILHFFLDSEETLSKEKKFVLTLVKDEFETENNYSMEKTLQLMNLNLSESICLSGIINNLGVVNLKKSGYIFKEEKSHIKFIFGMIKISVIASSVFILYKVSNNIYDSIKIAEYLYANGYYFIFLNILDDKSTIMQYSNNEFFKNMTALFDIELKRSIEIASEKKSNYLSLATQLSVYASPGILHIFLDTLAKGYTLVKHRRLYRGPKAIASALGSSILPIIACYSVIDYFMSSTEYVEDSERMQQYVGLDTSVLGINDINFKMSIIKTALTFALLQSYKIFLPITAPLVLKITDFWNYFRKKQ